MANGMPLKYTIYKEWVIFEVHPENLYAVKTKGNKAYFLGGSTIEELKSKIDLKEETK